MSTFQNMTRTFTIQKWKDNNQLWIESIQIDTSKNDTEMTNEHKYLEQWPSETENKT